MKQLLLDIQPPARPSFENFVVGRNAEALHTLQMLLEDSSEVRFLYLWGASGSGKTHLLNAFRENIPENNQHNIVLLDDVHLLSDTAQIALFNQYNQLRESGGRLLVAGISAPTQMGLRDDLATRLAWGLTYQLQPLTDEEKAQALKNYANARSMRLPDEVIDYCLRYLKRDLPTLTATITALDEWSLTYKKPVTLPLLKQLLQLPLL